MSEGRIATRDQTVFQMANTPKECLPRITFDRRGRTEWYRRGEKRHRVDCPWASRPEKSPSDPCECRNAYSGLQWLRSELIVARTLLLQKLQEILLHLYSIRISLERRGAASLFSRPALLNEKVLSPSKEIRSGELLCSKSPWVADDVHFYASISFALGVPASGDNSCL